MSRILVTPRSLTRSPDHVAADALRPLVHAGHTLVFGPSGVLPDEDTLRRLLPGCVGWLCGIEPVSARVLQDGAPSLRVISRNGAGIDNLPLDTAASLGIAVRRAAGVNAQGVAELAIALVLAALRDLPRSSAALAAGRWERTLGREIGGRTVGVVGCGAIGQRVVRAALGLGARVLAFDPAPDPAFRPGDAFGWCTLEDLIRSSEIVTLHCPPPPDGGPLIDAGRLATLPSGAVLVNTARAGLVDEDALVAALETGRVSRYATDVFATEPPPPSRLLRHPAVLATPHVGAYTAESVAKATRDAVSNLLDALATGTSPG